MTNTRQHKDEDMEELKKFMIPDHVPIPQMPKPPRYTRLFGWVKEPETPMEHLALNTYKFAMAGVAAGTLKIIGSTHRAMQFMVPTIQYRKMFAYHAKYWKGPMAWFVGVGLAYTLANAAVERYNKHDADEITLRQRFLIGFTTGAVAGFIEKRARGLMSFGMAGGIINTFPYATYSAYDLRERRHMPVNAELYKKPDTETLFNAARPVHGGVKRTLDDIEQNVDFTNKIITNFYSEDRRGRSVPIDLGPELVQE